MVTTGAAKINLITSRERKKFQLVPRALSISHNFLRCSFFASFAVRTEKKKGLRFEYLLWHGGRGEISLKVEIRKVGKDLFNFQGDLKAMSWKFEFSASEINFHAHFRLKAINHQYHFHLLPSQFDKCRVNARRREKAKMMNIKIMQIVLSYLFFMEGKALALPLTRNSNVNYSPLKEHDDKNIFASVHEKWRRNILRVIFTFFLHFEDIH